MGESPQVGPDPQAGTRTRLVILGVVGAVAVVVILIWLNATMWSEPSPPSAGLVRSEPFGVQVRTMHGPISVFFSLFFGLLAFAPLIIGVWAIVLLTRLLRVTQRLERRLDGAPPDDPPQAPPPPPPVT